MLASAEDLQSSGKRANNIHGRGHFLTSRCDGIRCLSTKGELSAFARYLFGLGQSHATIPGVIPKWCIHSNTFPSMDKLCVVRKVHCVQS